VSVAVQDGARGGAGIGARVVADGQAVVDGAENAAAVRRAALLAVYAAQALLMAFALKLKVSAALKGGRVGGMPVANPGFVGGGTAARAADFLGACLPRPHALAAVHRIAHFKARCPRPCSQPAAARSMLRSLREAVLERCVSCVGPAAAMDRRRRGVISETSLRPGGGDCLLRASLVWKCGTWMESASEHVARECLTSGSLDRDCAGRGWGGAEPAGCGGALMDPHRRQPPHATVLRSLPRAELADHRCVRLPRHASPRGGFAAFLHSQDMRPSPRRPPVCFACATGVLLFVHTCCGRGQAARTWRYSCWRRRCCC
jgi:hypothetical protein